MKTTVLMTCAVAACAAFGRGFTVYNVTAFSPGREGVAAADAAELRRRTGVDIALYSLTLHPEGRPAIAKAERYVESFRRFKSELEGSGVRAGVLVQAILGHWKRLDKEAEDWMRTVDSAGREVRFCPDDPGFAEYITKVFTLIAQSHPVFILTDDDVRGYSHNAECFCARHVARFNSRRGTSYTADELRAKLATARQDDPDYVAFLALQRETIEGVLKRARAAVDAVDPSIPGGICVAGEEHLFCAPLARAMAAKGQTPIMRAATASYMERMTAEAVPWNVCRMLGYAEYYRGWGIDVLCESDTFPHNLWSKSARSFMTHLTYAAFIGMKGAKAWYVNAHKGGFAVSRNYTDILAENRGLLSALADEVEGSEMDGLAVPCFTNFPNWHLVGNHGEFFMEGGNAGATTCAAFGLPFRAARDFDADRTYLLSLSREVARLSDEDLRRMFSHRVVVFREAAEALSGRGLDSLTGVRTERRELFFNREHDDALGADLAFSRSGDDVAFIAREGARTLATLGYRQFAGAARYEPATPSAVLYRNGLGGVALTLQYHAGMLPYQLYSEARRASLLSMIEKLEGRPLEFASAHDQDVLTLLRRQPDGTRLLLVLNLNPDPVQRVGFVAPAGECSVERLCGDGAWRAVASERRDGKVFCDVRLAFYEAAVLRIAQSPGPKEAADPEPKKVTRRICLLEDGDIGKFWYTWLKKVQKRGEDPDGIFTADGTTLKVSGADMGCVTTRDAYRDYRLTLEFRYVDNDVQLNKRAARDGGILFHSTGPDGEIGNGVWMSSFEYNIIQGAAGDLIVVGSKARRPGAYRCKGNVDPATKGTRSQHWDPDGPEVELVDSGRIRRPDVDLEWKNLKTQALSPNENPVGEWNKAEVVCRGNTAKFYFNGMKTGEYRDLSPAAGRIQLQSEGFGIEYRNIVLSPLD